MKLLGIYMGLVEENADPQKLGRLKVRVPTVYGVSGEISTGDLPWALPFGVPAGGSSASGGISFLPEVGDQVVCMFLDGEPEKPMWSWSMQTTPQAETLKLHHYASGSDGSAGKPDRAVFSRYGHSLELSADEVILTTSQGYQIRLVNSTGETGGSSSIQTPGGQRVSLSDLAQTVVIQGTDTVAVSGTNVVVNAATDALVRASNSFTLMVGTNLLTVNNDSIVLYTGSGGHISLDPSGNIAIMSGSGMSISIETDKVQVTAKDGTGLVVEEGKVSLTGTQAIINTSAMAIGTDAKYPAMMLTPSLLAWVMGHTHTTGEPGSPTSPPIPLNPLFPVDSGSTRLSLT